MNTRKMGSGILTILLVTAAASTPAEEAPQAPLEGAAFSVDWQTIDGGGGNGVSPSFQLLGTVGQAEAGDASSPSFEVEGGFWVAEEQVGDAELVFNDGFETGDATSWSSVVGGS